MTFHRVVSCMNKSTKIHVYAAVAAGLALSPIAAHAQTSPGTDTRGTTATSDATGTDVRGDRNDHHDYGWIGLAGLAGLAGLIRRRRDDRYDSAGSATKRSDFAGTRS